MWQRRKGIRRKGVHMDYQLKNESLTVGFSSLGGTLRSIKDKENVEYLWQGNKNYWSGQAPVLFPICGSLREDNASIGENQKTCMPRHGIVRKREFRLEKQTENEVSFSIESNAEMLALFPYEFKLYTQYELIHTSIVVTYTVENQSKQRMPFFLGGHPGFNCPLLEGERYEEYYLELEQKETCTIPTPVTETGLIDVEHRTEYLKQENRIPLRHELFHKDAIILDELNSRSVSLCSSKTGKGVRVEFKDYPYLILWSSSNDGPFIALEPWLGLSTCSDESDVFEEKRNVQFVEPLERKSYQFTITLL